MPGPSAVRMTILALFVATGVVPLSSALGDSSGAESLQLVFVTSESCPYAVEAAAALETLQEEVGQLVLSLTEVHLEAALQTKPAMLEYPVTSTPVLVFIANGREVWRATAPGNADELRGLLRDVSSGRTWAKEAQLLESGSLSTERAQLLASAYELAERRDAALDVYRQLLKEERDADVKQRLSRKIAFLGQSEAGLEDHLSRYPDDLVVSLSLARHRLRSKEEESGSLQAMVMRLLERVTQEPDSYEKSFRLSVLRLAHDFVVLQDSQSCEVLSKYSRQAMKLDPRDGLLLQEFLAVAYLCGDSVPTETAISEFCAAYDCDGMDQRRRARFGEFLSGLIRDAKKQATWARTATGER